MLNLRTYSAPFKDTRAAQVGDSIHCDGWDSYKSFVRLDATDDYRDASFPGCQFRVWLGNGLYHVATNIVLTGKPRIAYTDNMVYIRCRVEFVGDGMPSVFVPAWLFYTPDPI